jgi:hypothetical protein
MSAMAKHVLGIIIASTHPNGVISSVRPRR